MASIAYYAFTDKTLKKYVVHEKMLVTPLTLPDVRIPTELDGPTTVTLATLLAEAAGVAEHADADVVDECLAGILRVYPIVVVVETREDTTRLITHDLFRNASTFDTPEKEVIELVTDMLVRISALRGYAVQANGMSLYEVERRLKELATKAPGIIKRTWTRACDMFGQVGKK